MILTEKKKQTNKQTFFVRGLLRRQKPFNVSNHTLELLPTFAQKKNQCPHRTYQNTCTGGHGWCCKNQCCCQGCHNIEQLFQDNKNQNKVLWPKKKKKILGLGAAACNINKGFFPTIYCPMELIFLLKVEISSRTLIHYLCQDQSTMVQWAEMALAECCQTSVWAYFKIGSHTIPGQRCNQPTPTSLG